MFKKLSRLFIAVMMILSMTVGVHADNANTANLTIVKEGATFTTYQVLKATPSGDVYTYQVNDAFKDFFKGTYTFDETKGIIKDGKVFLPNDQLNTTVTTKPTKVVSSKEMAAFTKALQDYIKDNASKSFITKDIQSENATALDIGYYLVLETNNNKDDGIVASKAMMVNLVEDKTIYPKDDQGELTKKILKDNTGLDKNSAAIGDKIPYEVSAVIPTYDSSVKEVNYTFTDTMSKGLKYQDDLKVKLGDTILTKDTDYTLTVTGDATQGTTLVIKITNNNLLLTSTDKKIVLNYSAQLTSDAAVNDATKNSVKLVYSRIPGVNETTLEDSTETYTYGLKIIKKANDHSGETLEGAEFALFKGDVQIGKAVSTKTGEVNFTDMNGKTLGLDVGTYTLREVKAPSEYSTLGKDVKLTLTANTDLSKKPTMTVTTADGDIKEATIENDRISIVDYKGISLPETGGSGTTIFMIVGGGLVVIALVAYGIYELKGRKD